MEPTGELTSVSGMGVLGAPVPKASGKGLSIHQSIGYRNGTDGVIRESRLLREELEVDVLSRGKFIERAYDVAADCAEYH
jgi:hypothetical protein